MARRAQAAATSHRRRRRTSVRRPKEPRPLSVHRFRWALQLFFLLLFLGLLTAAFWAEKTLNAELRAQLERARDLAVRSGVFLEWGMFLPEEDRR